MPRKHIVVTLVFVCVAMLAHKPMLAQAPQSAPGQQDTAKAAADLDIQEVREDIRAHRKQVIAENMTLTPDEATKFWPIYDQYIQEAIKINDVRWSLMKDYAANYDTLSDQMAMDLIKKSAEVDQQLVALREKCVSIFAKAVSVRKTAQWYQLDRRLDLVINLQLSAMVPLVDTSK